MSVPQEYYDRYSYIQHTGRRKHAGQEVNRMSVLSESRQRQITQRAHRSELRITFAATLAMIDESVKSIMEVLERKDMLDNTIVVVMSDNGGAGEEHNLRPAYVMYSSN